MHVTRRVGVRQSVNQYMAFFLIVTFRDLEIWPLGSTILSRVVHLTCNAYRSSGSLAGSIFLGWCIEVYRPRFHNKRLMFCQQLFIMQFYTTSSIGCMFSRGLNTSSVWWCTGVCVDRHPATSLITSSQPLTLLLAAAVYDLPTGTVSLCFAVDSARTAVMLSTVAARQSGTRCLMNLDILTVLIVLNGSWKQFSLAATSVTSALEVIFIMRCAI